MEALKRIVYQTSVVAGASSESADVARQTRFPPGAGYHIVLSVVHPRPDALKVELDAGEAVEGTVLVMIILGYRQHSSSDKITTSSWVEQWDCGTNGLRKVVCQVTLHVSAI